MGRPHGESEAIVREVGFLLERFGQSAARVILRESVIRIGLAEGLPAGIQAARDVVAELDAHQPMLF